MLVYAPGWTLATAWLACFEIIPPPQKKWFFRGQKNKKSLFSIIIENCCSSLVSAKKNEGFFSLFLSESLSVRSRLSRTTSDPAQKNGKFQAKIALFFSVFPAKSFSRHSRLSRTTSGPTRLIRPRPIDCDRGLEQTVKTFPVLAPIFIFEHRHKKVFLSDP